MKKSTKLLSVILAVVMIFSSLGMTSFAATLFPDKIATDKAIYDSNDKGQAYFLTDEQRAAYFIDLVDNILLGLNINTSVAVIGSINLTSLDATVETLTRLKGLISVGGAFVDLGILEKLDYGKLNNQTRANNGDVGMCNLLFEFLNANANALGDIMEHGVSFGILAGSIPVDLSMLNDIPGLLKGIIHDLGVRNLSGVGTDPDFPDGTYWADLTVKPVLDETIKNLIGNLLTQPRWERYITNLSENTWSADPANLSKIHTIKAVDANEKPLLNELGQEFNYYYTYLDEKGLPAEMTDEQATAKNIAKTYIACFDEDSVLLPGFDTSIINFKTTTPYQLLDTVIPLLFDMLASPALNADLRTVLLRLAGAQFSYLEMYDKAGAFTPEHTAVYNQVKSYLEMTDEAFTAAAKADPNLSGTKKYFFVKIGDNNYNVVSGAATQSWTEIYPYSMDPATTNAFADIANWDYQIGTWAELTAGTGYTSGTSVLRNASDLVGKIINEAIPVNAGMGWNGWAMDSGAEDNAHFESNLNSIVKYVLKSAPDMILGEGTELPADFDSYSVERVLTLIVADIVNWLMPTILLPDDVTTIEEILVYAVREFMAEIYPEYGQAWDAQIATAKTKTGLQKDDAFLDIALNMGMSTGVYYLKNFMGLGSSRGESGGITLVVGPSASWESIAVGIVDNCLRNYLKGLSSHIISKNAAVFNNPEDIFGRVSAIVNSIFPNFLSLITNCGDSTQKQFNFETLFNKFRGILNGELVPLVSCVYRNEAGLANKGVTEALVTIIVDLVGGIGFNDTAITDDFSRLAGIVTGSLSQANPFDYLVSKSTLNSLVDNLVWVLSDATSHPLWFQTLVTVIIMITGDLWEMSYNGASQTTNATQFYGNATAAVNVTVDLSTKGIPQIAYKEGYRNGTMTQYGGYSGIVTRMVAKNVDGVSAPIELALNTPITSNTLVKGTLNIPADESIKLYTVTSYYQVKLPNGELLANGKEYSVSTMVMVTSAARTVTNKYLARGMWYNQLESYVGDVVYLDENASFSQLDDIKMTFTGKADKGGIPSKPRTGQLRIPQLGALNLNEATQTYSIDRTGLEANTVVANWQIIDSQGNVTSKPYTDPSIPFFNNSTFIFNNKRFDTDYSETANYWVYNPSADRSMFTDDFSSMTMYYDGSKCQVWGGNWASNTLQNKGTLGVDSIEGISSTIMMYNSYGLKGLLDKALSSGRIADDFTPESWAGYVSALQNAMTVMYGTWVKTTFIADNTEDLDANPDTPKTSKFKRMAEEFVAATGNLVPVADSSEASDTGHTAAELAEIKATADAIKAQAQVVKGDYKDYALYSYLRFSNAYGNVIWKADSVVAPTGVADKTLKGVNLNTADIAALVAAMPEGQYKTIISKMIKEPTAEATQAAQKQLADWNKNPVTIDIASLQANAYDVSHYITDVVKKYSDADRNDSTKVKYYLNDAVSFVQSEIAAGVTTGKTAESVAKLNAVLATANALLADVDAMHSTIHATRYALIVAYKSLVAIEDAADFTALEAAIANAETLLAQVTVGDTLDVNVENLMLALGYKATSENGEYWVGGSDCAKAVAESKGLTGSTDYVDATTKTLTTAIAKLLNLTPSKDNEGHDNSTVVPDELVISGVMPKSIANAGDLEALVQLAGLPAGVTATIEEDFTANNGRKGTGSVVNVKVGDQIVLSYSLVIFGDVNGDGNIDMFDAFASSKGLAGAQTFEKAYAKAADANKDGIIDAADYGLIKQALAGTAINQTA